MLGFFGAVDGAGCVAASLACRALLGSSGGALEETAVVGATTGTFVIEDCEGGVGDCALTAGDRVRFRGIDGEREWRLLPGLKAIRGERLAGDG